MNKEKLLIVDDDEIILRFLKEFFTLEGYNISTATDGTSAIAQFKSYQPDLVILDIMMSKMDGFETCLNIRENSKVPIIFLSAKNETQDKIMGLTFGSDDYITKPFDSAELLLRVKAILRRAAENETTKNDCHDVIHIHDLSLNRTTREVTKNGTKIQLTTMEFDLLWLLASYPQRVFTKSQLIEQVWNAKYFEDTGMVAVMIKRLREKIEDNPASPGYIKTVRGLGYKFEFKPC